MSSDAMLIEVTRGKFTGRLGVAIERDGRWVSRLDAKKVYDDVSPNNFRCICRIDHLLELLGETVFVNVSGFVSR